jgi:hypothetical protein
VGRPAQRSTADHRAPHHDLLTVPAGRAETPGHDRTGIGCCSAGELPGAARDRRERVPGPPPLRESWPTPGLSRTARLARPHLPLSSTVYSARCSLAIRTARALNSASILFGMTASSWTQTGAASNLGRFIIELHRRITRGCRNRDNYRLRMFPVAGVPDPDPYRNADEPTYTYQHAKEPCHSRTLCRSQCLFEWRWFDGRFHQRSVGALDRNSGNICGKRKRRRSGTGHNCSIRRSRSVRRRHHRRCGRCLRWHGHSRCGQS